MTRITAENIYLLRNSTGKPFTDLLDRLIRSSAATLRLPPSAVLDNPRVNHPDGGVDTQVDLGSTSDPTGYFNVFSAWQYKGISLRDFSNAKVTEEISGESKEYVRALLRKGYAYRLCIADDEPAERKARIKSILDTEINKVNPDAPEAVVLFASDVVDWVNKFPAIAAEMLGSSMKDYFHFATWENRERAVTKMFVETPDSSMVFESVKRHLDWSHRPSTVRLTISGDAGVGKSRTVFEAIAALPQVASLVLYTEDENKALDLARAVANQSDLYAVIVADECPDETGYQLTKLLMGVEHRVRLVTIDNALEHAAGSELRLSRVSTVTVEKIVSANFPDVDQGRRYRYCNLSEGYLRFAIFLCDNDALIVQQGHLGELLSDTKSYLGTLFGRNGPFEGADYEALMVVSLVERCGAIDNVFWEMESLCALVGLDARSVRERVHAMQKKNGLVARAGRYFYVTPTPIAMVCFHSAWSKWAELSPKVFLDKFPPALIPQFLSRTARAPEEIGRVVTAYFQEWALSRGGSIFGDANETAQLLYLVRSAPERMIPRLRDLVLAARPEQLGGQFGDVRRKLVTEAGEIASFPQWFKPAEEILFALACHESEPNLGNNATKVWVGLFLILSHLPTPFVEKLDVLRSRIGRGDLTAKILVVEALRNSLEGQSPHFMSDQPYGHRIAPSRWLPKTYEELRGYIEDLIRELSALCSDPNEEVKDKAIPALVSCICNLVLRGFTKQARAGAGTLSTQVRPVLRAGLRELMLINNSKHNSSSQDERRKIEFLEDWIAELASQNFHDRLVEEVGSEPWDHHLEQADWEDRIRELASQLQRLESFEIQLEWLCSEKARSAVEFGIQLGKLDDTLTLADRIIAACRSSRNPNLTRGYFVGVSQATTPKLPSAQAELVRGRLNEALDELWADDPVLAFHVMTPSGDFVHSFDRAIAAVRVKAIRAGFLHTFVAWNGPRQTRPSEVRDAAETLLASARGGDEDAANTGIELVAFLLVRMGESDDKLLQLQLLFEDKSLTTIFGLLEQAANHEKKLSHWFGDVFTLALPANPDGATSVLVQMMKNESYKVGEQAANLFPIVAAARPRELMDGMGEVMLSNQRTLSFLFRSFPLSALSDDVILRWLAEHGVEGARLLARHVPRPVVGANGPELHLVTAFILERFGDDEIVFSSWVAGMHNGQAFWGSMVDHIEHRAATAQPFLTFPIAAVRRWAQSEISFAEQNADQFRLNEKEEF